MTLRLSVFIGLNYKITWFTPEYALNARNMDTLRMFAQKAIKTINAWKTLLHALT